MILNLGVYALRRLGCGNEYRIVTYRYGCSGCGVLPVLIALNVAEIWRSITPLDHSAMSSPTVLNEVTTSYSCPASASAWEIYNVIYVPGRLNGLRNWCQISNPHDVDAHLIVIGTTC